MPPRPPGVLLSFAWMVLALCAGKWLVVDSILLGINLGGGAGVPLVMNVQMIAAAVLFAATLVLLHACGLGRAGAVEPSPDTWLRLARVVPVGAALLLLWGLSLETLRAVEHAEAAGVQFAWGGVHVRALWLTILWAVGGFALVGYTRLRPWRSLFTTGWVILIGAALTWLVYDTLYWRMESGVTLAVPFANLQFLAGALVLLLLAVALTMSPRFGPTGQPDPFMVGSLPWIAAVIAAVGLWLGSLELDRIFAPEAANVAEARMVRQTALSIYWGLYGIGLVVLGFARRLAWFRYGGLALLALTLGKVLVVDMARVKYLYRVLSLLGVGLLCIATSVAYAKLAGRLLATPPPPTGARQPREEAETIAGPT
jgi:uncharacterized membrane protein